MFRNLRLYRFEGAWPDSEESLSSALEAAAFEPCGPLTERSSGFVPVAPDAGDGLARRVGGMDLLRLRTQSRVLPAAAVNEELDNRIEAYRARMQELPSAREKRRLKAEARDELMPKALLKSDRIWAFADPQQALLAVGTGQEAVAERLLRRLSAAVNGLNPRPLQFRQPVEELLTKVFFGDAPRQFIAGRECRMQDLKDRRSVVRWTDFDLAEPSIRNHVADGMRLTHLAVEYASVTNCVISEEGVVSKLRFLDDDADLTDSDDPLARLDAEFVLESGTLRNLVTDMGKLLGGIA